MNSVLPVTLVPAVRRRPATPARGGKAAVAKLYRDFANEVAARLARKLGKPAPKCWRVTTRRGHGHRAYCQFSVPVWAFYAHPAYRLYYILHECVHCFLGAGHDPAFMRLEAELLEAEGIRLIRNERSSNGYARELRDVQTGEVLCEKWGRCW